jgi:DNA polymerase-2
MVKQQRFDDKLIYKKRLRKGLEEYTVHIPPHVQAAKLLDSPPHLVRYVMTTSGPQPIERQTAPLDYVHYIESQLRPVADTLLPLIGNDFDSIVTGQTSLF